MVLAAEERGAAMTTRRLHFVATGPDHMTLAIAGTAALCADGECSKREECMRECVYSDSVIRGRTGEHSPEEEQKARDGKSELNGSESGTAHQ